MSNTLNRAQSAYRAYIAGYLLSFVLTIIAYWVVVNHKLSGSVAMYFIGLLALTQFIVQMKLFLHLGKEDKPKYQQTAFYYALGVVVILVFGSIWIMNNLDYHHKGSSKNTSEQTDNYIIKDEGIQIHKH